MFDCYCSYEVPTAYHSEMRKARKIHRCNECCGTTLPGEKYERYWGIIDGNMYHGKTCERCVDIRNWMKINVPCFCWAHGNMIDDARNTAQNAHEQAGDEVLGLRFGLLRRIVMRDKFNERVQ